MRWSIRLFSPNALTTSPEVEREAKIRSGSLMKASSSSIFSLLLLSWLVFFPTQAHALIENAYVLDDILTRYKDAANAWAAVITDRASWLVWLLVVISMVWPFGRSEERRVGKR